MASSATAESKTDLKIPSYLVLPTDIDSLDLEVAADRFVETEYLYVEKSLRVLAEARRRLIAHNELDVQRVLKDDEIERIFISIEAVYELNQRMLDALMKIRFLGMQKFLENLGQTLNDFVPFIGLYQEYLVKTHDAIARVNKLLEENKNFRTFVALHEHATKTNLETLLRAPLVRYPQYIVYLQSILSSIKKDHPARVSLEATVEKFHANMDAVVQRLRGAKERNAVTTAQMGYFRNNVNLVDASRRCLAEADLQLVEVNGAKTHRFFLFNDCIVQACPGGTFSSPSVKEVLLIAGLSVRDVPPEEGQGENAFLLSSSLSRVTWLLKASEARVKRNWVRFLDEVIRESGNIKAYILEPEEFKRMLNKKDYDGKMIPRPPITPVPPSMLQSKRPAPVPPAPPASSGSPPSIPAIPKRPAPAPPSKPPTIPPQQVPSLVPRPPAGQTATGSPPPPPPPPSSAPVAVAAVAPRPPSSGQPQGLILNPDPNDPQLVAKLGAWECLYDPEENDFYYENTQTRENQWEKPECFGIWSPSKPGSQQAVVQPAASSASAASSIPPPPPSAGSSLPPPPPSSGGGASLPPPPPSAGGGSSLPPPPPSSGGLPPPPPSGTSPSSGRGDARSDLFSAIRQGASLKTTSEVEAAPTPSRDGLFAEIKAGAGLRKVDIEQLPPEPSPSNSHNDMLAAIRAGSSLKKSATPVEEVSASGNSHDELLAAIRAGTKLKKSIIVAPEQPVEPAMPSALQKSLQNYRRFVQMDDDDDWE